MTLSDILARTAEGNALIYGNIVTDNGGFTDYRSRSVVYEKSSADLRSGMDFNSRFSDAVLRDHSRNEKHIVVIEPMRFSVASDRLKARIKQNNLKRRGSGRIPFTEAIYIFFYSIKQQNPPFRSLPKYEKASAAHSATEADNRGSTPTYYSESCNGDDRTEILAKGFPPACWRVHFVRTFTRGFHRYASFSAVSVSDYFSR